MVRLRDLGNTIIVVGKGEIPRPVACVVLASTRLDVNGLVRKRLASTHWKRRLPTVAMISPSAIGESYLRPVDY